MSGKREKDGDRAVDDQRDAGASARGEREERLSAALRANLRRRKQQQQARQATAGGKGPSGEEPSDGQ